MNRNSIQFKMISNLVLVFLLLTAFIVVQQVMIINKLVIKASNERIKLNMRSGWYFFQEKQKKLEMILDFLQNHFRMSDKPEELLSITNDILSQYAGNNDIDYLWLLPVNESLSQNEFFKKIINKLEIQQNNNISGYIKHNFKELSYLFPFDFQSKHQIPDGESISLLACRKVNKPNGDGLNNEGDVILIAGCWIDGANYFVDQIQNLVFEDRFYKGRRVGTVTLFNGSYRVATTVLLPNGQRAVGTQVSEEVKQQTLIRGIPWIGRAKVLNDWYLACYEPIRDIDGNIIGMLYMGELEAVSKDARTFVVLITVSIILLIMTVALVIRLKQTTSLIRRIYKLRNSAIEFANGNYRIRAEQDPAGDEISELVNVFNAMLETIEKDREQLVQQQELIEEANANYLDMLSFVTHELRNSLGSALFNIASLKEGAFGEVSEGAKEGLDIIESSLTYLKEITNNYLQLSRIEQGEIYFEKKDVNLQKDVIQPVLDEFAKLLGTKGITVENQVEDNFTFPADVNLMRVVYENLLGNAIKYGKEKGCIKIDAKRVEDGKVRLSVWNDGPSIEPPLISSLFHRFKRFDTNTAEGKKGAGLGLFIVKRIVELHGGTITVHSSPEEGTSFIIDIPG